MLGSDGIGAHGARRGERHFQNPLAAGSKVVGGQMCGISAANDVFQLFHQLVVGHAALFQHCGGDAAALPQQSKQHVLAADIGVTKLFCRFHGKIHGLIGFFGKSIEFKHNIISPLHFR